MRYLLLAALALLAGCGGIDAPQAAAPEPTAMELPDGRTASPAQQAYIEAVTPSLSDEKAGDVLAVLQSGEDGVCGVWLHPSDAAVQQQSIQLLMSSSGYNQTEATVITRAAAEHLCPDK